MTGKNTGRSKIPKKTPEEDLKSPKKHRNEMQNHRKTSKLDLK